MTSDTEFLTPTEVAKTLRVDLQTLQLWRGKKSGPPWMRVGPRTVLYRRSGLIAFIEAAEQRAVA